MKNSASEDTPISSTWLFLLSTFVWSLSFVVAEKGASYGWYGDGSTAIGAIAINVALGVLMVLAYMRHLRAMDELHRKIQMDALALAMGAALVGGFALVLLQSTGLRAELQLENLIMFIVVTHIASTIVGHLRYR